MTLTRQPTAEIVQALVIPGRAKAAAILSLALWFGVMTMGRLIGYYEPRQAAPASAAQQVAPQ